MLRYYDKKFLENLKAQTPFMSTAWICACGLPAAHMVSEHDMNLCDGCFFRLKVMSAAGRFREFEEDYDAKKGYYTENVQNRLPLPKASGKSIQMFMYKPVSKP